MCDSLFSPEGAATESRHFFQCSAMQEKSVGEGLEAGVCMEKAGLVAEACKGMEVYLEIPI